VTRGRMFEPFFTTKAGRNAGIGLATVARIAEGCSGGIRVDSRPGEGSMFEILLPRMGG
jgi:two-component system cell cycle sensor histidine kinase/response regulator CckA